MTIYTNRDSEKFIYSYFEEISGTVIVDVITEYLIDQPVRFLHYFDFLNSCWFIFKSILNHRFLNLLLEKNTGLNLNWFILGN